MMKRLTSNEIHFMEHCCAVCIYIIYILIECRIITVVVLTLGTYTYSLINSFLYY